MIRKKLSHERLKSLLHYDPETGVFTWAVARKNGQLRAGTVAGSIKENGYVRLEVDQRTYFAHRLAWFYMTGSEPETFIDHIDNCRSNNAFSNLRLASKSENRWNETLRSTNTSGYKGVTWSKKSQKWQASIRVKGKSLHVGLFERAEDAFAAAQEARKLHHGEFANSGLPLPQKGDA